MLCCKTPTASLREGGKQEVPNTRDQEVRKGRAERVSDERCSERVKINSEEDSNGAAG
jgi:hypothetical protein